MELEPRSDADRQSWRTQILLIVGAAGLLLGFQLAEVRIRPASSVQEPGQWGLILQGDMLSRYALAAPGHTDAKQAAQAVESYHGALPSPAAYRRLGVATVALLGKEDTSDFLLINSRRAVEGLDDAHVAKLNSEVSMWRRVFSRERLSAADARRFARRIDDLNLGPLRDSAKAIVYRHAGLKADESAAIAAARNDARASIDRARGVFYGLAIAGMLGFALGLYYLARYARALGSRERPVIRSGPLVLSFVVYLVVSNFLSVVIVANLAIAGASRWLASSDLAVFIIQGVSTVSGLGFALAVLRRHTSPAVEGLAEAGLRLSSAKQSLKWGLGAFCVSIPLIAAAQKVTVVLERTVWRNVQTPDQPFGPVFAFGSGAAVAMVFVLAVVVAPVAEEVVFRGALYTALRKRMSVWLAAVFSAAVFAVGHPLPGGFVLIFVLGMVLALVREETGSVVPAIVCHSAYNCMALMLVRVIA